MTEQEIMYWQNIEEQINNAEDREHILEMVANDLIGEILNHEIIRSATIGHAIELQYEYTEVLNDNSEIVGYAVSNVNKLYNVYSI